MERERGRERVRVWCTKLLFLLPSSMYSFLYVFLICSKSLIHHGFHLGQISFQEQSYCTRFLTIPASAAV